MRAQNDVLLPSATIAGEGVFTNRNDVDVSGLTKNQRKHKLVELFNKEETLATHITRSTNSKVKVNKTLTKFRSYSKQTVYKIVKCVKFPKTLAGPL